MKFITGMNRDRDGYQVAGALAEGGMLATLVTDYYAGATSLRIPALNHRQSELVPPSAVRVVNRALISQLRHRALSRAGYSGRPAWHRIDSWIAEAIRDESKKRPSDGLLVYSNYAWKAFESAPSSTFKGLFQYHPGASAVRAGLDVDELATAAPWEDEPELSLPERRRVYELETTSADRIICASSFTARGLALDGVGADRLRIVPYGCPKPPKSVDHDRSRMILFVGQGVQRKGLHILAAAWAKVKAPGWTLRIVSSRLDPQVRQALQALDQGRVHVSGAVDATELENLYRRSSALVLPSLVEGFGLVLGEALSRGCRLIASTNTGLPDLHLPSEVATTVPAGEIESLHSAIEAHIQDYEHGARATVLAVQCAADRSWSHFRKQIRAAL